MAILIENTIDECFDGDVRPRARTTSSVFHRLTFRNDDGAGKWDYVYPIPDQKLTAPLVAARFRDRRSCGDWRDRPGVATGGQMPYHGLIKPSGVLQQALRLEDMGAHALKFNATGLGWAVVGDFRVERPTSAQWETCVWLGAHMMALGQKLFGHTERKGTSRNLDKQCPGQYFDMNRLRIEAASMAEGLDAHTATKQLRAQGMVI